MSNPSATRMASILVPMLTLGSLRALPAQTATPFSGRWIVAASTGIALSGSQDDIHAAMRTADLGKAGGLNPGTSAFPATKISGRSLQVALGRQVAPRVEIRALFEKSDGLAVTGSNVDGKDPKAPNGTFLVLTPRTTTVAVMPLGELNRFFQLGGGLELAFVKVRQQDALGESTDKKTAPGMVAHFEAKGSYRNVVSLRLALEQHLTAPIDVGPYSVRSATGGVTTLVPETTMHSYHTSVTFGAAVHLR